MADIDTLPKFLLLPLLDGYSVTLGNDVLTTYFESGQPRQRLKGGGAPHTVPVTFRHLEVHQQYARAFWETYRAQPFAMRLKINDGDLQWYSCRFVSAPSFTPLGADIYEFSVSLSVKPRPINADENLALMWVYEQTDGDLLTYTNLLEKLVNESLPEAVGSLNDA